MCSTRRLTVGCVLPENGHQLGRCRDTNGSLRGEGQIEHFHTPPNPNSRVKGRRGGDVGEGIQTGRTILNSNGAAGWNMRGAGCLCHLKGLILGPGSFPGYSSLDSLNQPSHPSLPACHHATLPAQRRAATSWKDLPPEQKNPSTLTVFFVFSTPSNGVFLTLLGISTTQPQHVVLHQPGHLLPSLASPMLVRGVQDQRKILFKLQMKKQGWLPLMWGHGGVMGAPRLAFPADAICSCDVESR